MFIRIVFTCVVVCMQSLSSDAVECYNCTRSPNLTDCNDIVKCPTDSACSLEYEFINGTRFYTLGCKDVMTCVKFPTVSSGGSSTLIGRAVSDPQNCSECCHNNNCNRQLCQEQDPRCADDKSFDCARIGAITNICDDASHIKPYCRRFCGFCETVDGDWSNWSQWSLCDVTCGNGTQTKTRSCSDPPPTNGGRDCVGGNLQHKPCSRDLCPVHGGWSRWSDWQSCSVSCDIGLQRRERTCSNPAPARSGDHCYGDATGYALCSPGPCANGSWSTWEAWVGCSVSCGGGLTTRSRHCDNPAPSVTGSYCDGDPVQSAVCNTIQCQGPVVFYAKELSTYSPGASANLRFTNVTTNVGNAYNSRTGYFTAPVNGTYSFSVQICTLHQIEAQVGIYINEHQYQSLQTYGADAYGSGRTMSVTVLLMQGDKVHAKTDPDTGGGQVFTEDEYRINSFSGALVMRL